MSCRWIGHKAIAEANKSLEMSSVMHLDTAAFYLNIGEVAVPSSHVRYDGVATVQKKWHLGLQS